MLLVVSECLFGSLTTSTVLSPHLLFCQVTFPFYASSMWQETMVAITI